MRTADAGACVDSFDRKCTRIECRKCIPDSIFHSFIIDLLSGERTLAGVTTHTVASDWYCGRHFREVISFYD